jgi:hypothetical protein
MRLMRTIIVVCLVAAFGGCTESHDKPGCSNCTVLPLKTLKAGRGQQKFFAGHLKERRRTTPHSFTQPIPGSRLQKFHVIQYDIQPDGRPDRDWRPRFVIVWKAENFKSIGGTEPSHPSTIWINDRLIRPPSGKKAIYALQPDYSVKQLPITAEETSRLLSYITTVEKQTDERVDSLVERIKQDEPGWEKQMSAEIAREERFPSDPYWEQRVDSHLKVVEPSQESPDTDRDGKSKRTAS